MRLRIEAGVRVGRCRLVSLIGEGSMGVVWEAWHLTLGVPVAVKILKDGSDRRAHRRALERFRQEAQYAARVNHPSVVRVLDYGEEEVPYLVMELVHGPDLHAWIRQQGVVDELVALKVAGHVAIGLAVLHEAGIVHRDLKPSNILIDQARVLKLSDLGLARSPDETVVGDQISGTPHYIAPECLDPARGIDPRSDLYALGVLLFRMLLGRLPFTGTSMEVLRRQMWETPDWRLPPGRSVDAGSLYLAMRLLEKDPERRIRNAREVVQACREQLARLETKRALEERFGADLARRGADGGEGRRWRPLLREHLACAERSQRKTAPSWWKRAVCMALVLLLAAGAAIVGMP